MKAEQTIQEQTDRYEATLALIRSEQPVSNEEIQWFADTSMKFANTLAQLFNEAERVNNSAVKLINLVVQTVDSTPELAAAVLELAIVTGNLTAEDVFGEENEVLQ